MDGKFSNLVVRATIRRPAASGKFIDVVATAAMGDMFKLDGQDAGQFDIAFARSLVTPYAVELEIADNDVHLFGAKLVDRKSWTWLVGYHPTDEFPIVKTPEYPDQIVHGKSENRYDNDDTRMFAKNTLEYGLIAFGIYSPRESTPKVKTAVVVPPEIQAALDGLPEDTPDDVRATILALTARGLQAQARSEQAKKRSDSKKTAANVAVAAKPLGKVHTTINVPAK